MPPSLCLFLGEANSFNVQKDTENIVKILSGVFSVHIVTTEPNTFNSNAFTDAQLFGTSFPSTKIGILSALSKYFRENDPVVAINVIEPSIHGTIVAVLARYYGIPAVYRYSGDRFNAYTVGRGRKRVLWFALNNVLGRVPLPLVDAHITMGSTGKSRLTDRNVDSDRISILPPPIDQTRFDGVSETISPFTTVPDKRSIALFVGRRSYMKGFDTFDDTIPQILDQRDDLQFVFVGGGDRVPQVPDQYTDHITVVGRVPPESMPKYFYHADVLVHPSLTESFGRVLVEALMCDTPVIARDVGDMGSVTTNTFTTDSEFVDMVCEFEDLPLDNPEPFSVEALKEPYESFFTKFA